MVVFRFKWFFVECGEWDIGCIVYVLFNVGLIVDFLGCFFNVKGWWVDLEEVEVVWINEIDGFLEKYKYIEKMYWVVCFVLFLIGLLVVVCIGVVVVNLVI